MKGSTTVQKEYIEKLVFIHDTIWMEPDLVLAEARTTIRDTVYIEVPAAPNSDWVNEEEVITPSKNKELVKAPQPSSVEFIFGKKPLKKLNQDQGVFILESGIVKKTEKHNNGLITLPINKN